MIREQKRTPETSTVEDLNVLGCYAAQVCIWLPTFRDSVSVPIQGLSSPEPLKIRQIRSPETSVANYQPTPRNIPDKRRPPVHGGRKPEISHSYDCFDLSVSHLFPGYVVFRIFRFPLLQQSEHIAQPTLIFVFGNIFRTGEGSK